MRSLSSILNSGGPIRLAGAASTRVPPPDDVNDVVPGFSSASIAASDAAERGNSAKKSCTGLLHVPLPYERNNNYH